MQGNKLVPGGQNILPRRSTLGPPYRRSRDRPLNPLKNLGKSARLEVGAHLLGLLGGVRRVVMIAGESRDDGSAELVGLGISQFQRGHLLQVLVQEPGVV